MWIRTSLLAAVASVAAPAAALAADRRVPQQYPSIQAAADAAEPGDRVVIGPGRYTESVSVAKSDIAFVGKRAVWFGFEPGFGHRDCLVATGDGISVSGITFREGIRQIFIAGNGATISKCTLRYAADSAVVIAGDDATVARCRIVAPHGFGVTSTGSRHLVSRTSFDACGASAVMHPYQGDDLVVTRCSVRACLGRDAIYAGGARARVESCSVTHSGSGAIYLYGPQAVGERNVVVGAQGYGISVTGPGFRIADNTVSGCRGKSAAVAGRDDYETGTAEFVSGNVVTDCLGGGISFSVRDAEFTRNRVERCGGDGAPGFLLFEQSRDNRVEWNTVADCGGDAFYFEGDVDDVLIGNFASGCARDGFRIRGQDIRMERCTATENGIYGIRNEATGTSAVGCTFLGNYVDVVNAMSASFKDAESLADYNRYQWGGPGTLPDRP